MGDMFEWPVILIEGGIIAAAVRRGRASPKSIIVVGRRSTCCLMATVSSLAIGIVSVSCTRYSEIMCQSLVLDRFDIDITR